MRETVLAALRRDPELVPKIAGALKEKIGDGSRTATVVQAAGALEPILEEAVRKRPSRLDYSVSRAPTSSLAWLSRTTGRTSCWQISEEVSRSASCSSI